MSVSGQASSLQAGSATNSKATEDGAGAKMFEVREASNKHIVESLRPSDFGNDLLEIHAKNAQLGAISEMAEVDKSLL